MFALILGPLIVFSESSPLVADNPVNYGSVGISIQVNKSMVVDVEHSEVFLDDLMRQVIDESESRIHSSINYDIYSNENIYFRPMTEEAWSDTGPFVDKYKVTETRQFEASQVQLLAVEEKPKNDWALSEDAINQLMKDLNTTRRLAGQKLDGASPINITFVFNYEFNRGGPPAATYAHTKDNRTLDYSLYDDCKTGEELEIFAQSDCGKTPDWDEWKQINLIQAYNPKLVLG